MLGETFTGKTSLVLRFAEGYYRDAARNPTVGAFFISKRLTVNGTTAKLQIWDTAGQEQFKRLAPMYYKNAAAAIVCYDVTSPKSFETLECTSLKWMYILPRTYSTYAFCNLSFFFFKHHRLDE
jgi:small GTP-binding protein